VPVSLAVCCHFTCLFAGPFLEPVLAALERYGDHCKAAYIMFEQFKDNGNQVPAIIGDNVLAQANR
jgi:hypothetical protein